MVKIVNLSTLITVKREIFADEKFRDFKVKVCEINFAILIFAISNEPTFELGDRINYCGFSIYDSVYSPRNRENKNPAKISRYTVSHSPYSYVGIVFGRPFQFIWQKTNEELLVSETNVWFKSFIYQIMNTCIHARRCLCLKLYNYI